MICLPSFSSSSSSRPSVRKLTKPGSSWRSKTTGPYTRRSLKNIPIKSNPRELPVFPLMRYLDQLYENPSSIDLLHQLLFDPIVVSRIVRHRPNAHVSLFKYFLHLEKFYPLFIAQLALKIVSLTSDLANNLPKELNYRSILGLGTMFMESGCYAEAIVIFHLAKDQCDSQLEQLDVSRSILICESLISVNQNGARTMQLLNIQLRQPSLPLDSVCLSSISQAISLSYFERCQFEDSFNTGLVALKHLDEQACSKSTIINTYRQLAKTCIAMRRPQQANLLITQAQLWAEKSYGDKSVQYAEVLEDYAFCLLAQEKDYEGIYNQALSIYRANFGADFNRFAIAQGNLPLRLYIENIAHRTDERSMIEALRSMVKRGDGVELTGSEQRLTMASVRVKALMAADQACRKLCCSPFGNEMNVGLNDKVVLLPIAAVQRDFHILNFNCGNVWCEECYAVKCAQKQAEVYFKTLMRQKKKVANKLA